MKIFRRVISIIMISILAVSVVGCSSEQKEKEAGIQVYYVNNDATSIEKEQCDVDEDSADAVSILIELLGKDGREEGHYKSIPEGVTVNGYSFRDDIVVVDFNDKYNDLDTQHEVLCRASVVLTLTQIEKVKYVAFTIEGKPYKGSDNKFVGAMTASDFVSSLGGHQEAEHIDDFKLYFATEDGSTLKEYNLENANYGEKTREQFIVEQLIKGPQKDGYSKTLSPDIKVNSVVTVDNICYVDFSESFNSEQAVVTNALAIYSIVNSLIELNEVHKVQISIKGDSMVKYHDEINLAEPFIRNLNYLQQNKK